MNRFQTLLSISTCAPTGWNLPHTCVFQSDIVGFTALTQRIAPAQLVAMLHALFAAIDGICDKHQVEKIETIGDAYLAATGCTASPEGICVRGSARATLPRVSDDGGDPQSSSGRASTSSGPDDAPSLSLRRDSGSSIPGGNIWDTIVSLRRDSGSSIPGADTVNRLPTSGPTSISRQDSARLVVRCMSNDQRRQDSDSATHRAAAASIRRSQVISPALRSASMPSGRPDSANSFSFTRARDSVAVSNIFGSKTSVRDSVSSACSAQTEAAGGKVGSVPRESGRNGGGGGGGGGSVRAAAASDRGASDGGSGSGGGGSGGSDGDGDGSPAVSAGGTTGGTRRLRTYPDSHVCRLARMALDVQVRPEHIALPAS